MKPSGYWELRVPHEAPAFWTASLTSSRPTGTFRDLRGGKSSAPVLIYGTEGAATGKSAGYEPLIQQIVRSFETGQSPVPAEETIEILAFMSAADVSRDRGGAPVSVADLIRDASR